MGARKTANFVRNDHRFLGRAGEAEDIQVIAADGSRVRDARGRTFIDFTMGWCVGNLGWNPEPIVSKVRAFKGPSYVHPSFVYPRWADLASLLVEVAPGEPARAYRATTGTEAVELALQLAMTATGRHKVISLEGAYHGNSFAARSIGEGEAPSLLRGCMKLKPPLDARALERLERMLAHRDVAAFIMEPIAINLGVEIPSAEFMRELVPLCHRHGTLVIADEVACGWGRTGRLFGGEHFDLAPDLMCVAKAVTSGVAPLASVLATEQVARDAEDLHFYATFGWHPLAVEAAIATVRYWQLHGEQLLANVAERSNEIRRRLSTALPDEAELTMLGLAVAIHTEEAQAIGERCRERGLIVSPEEDVLLVLPALTIDAETLAEGLDILESAMNH
jgi:4-aminobutyrate aminotransferase-like enzyme